MSRKKILGKSPLRERLEEILVSGFASHSTGRQQTQQKTLTAGISTQQAEPSAFCSEIPAREKKRKSKGTTTVTLKRSSGSER